MKPPQQANSGLIQGPCLLLSIYSGKSRLPSELVGANRGQETELRESFCRTGHVVGSMFRERPAVRAVCHSEKGWKESVINRVRKAVCVCTCAHVCTCVCACVMLGILKLEGTAADILK